MVPDDQLSETTPSTTRPASPATLAAALALASASSGYSGPPMPMDLHVPRNSKGEAKRDGTLHQTDARGQYDASGKRGPNDPCWCGSINPETGRVRKLKKCTHPEYRAKLEESRAKFRAEHRAGTCPSCKAGPGVDEAVIIVPPGNKPRPYTECPDCGRKLRYEMLVPGAQTPEVAPGSPVVQPGTIVTAEGQPAGPTDAPAGIASLE